MYQKVSTLKFCNFNFVLEGIKCFNILRLQELGVGLDGFSILVLGVFSLVRFLLSVLMVFPLSILILMCYADVLKNPSKNVINTQKTTRKYGIIGVTMLWAYALLAKIASFYRA